MESLSYLLLLRKPPESPWVSTSGSWVVKASKANQKQAENQKNQKNLVLTSSRRKAKSSRVIRQYLTLLLMFRPQHQARHLLMLLQEEERGGHPSHQPLPVALVKNRKRKLNRQQESKQHSSQEHQHLTQ